MTKRTPEEKQEIMENLRALTKSGSSAKDACKELKISLSNYYAWNKLTRRRKASKSQEITTVLYPKEEIEQNTFVFYGKSKDLAYVLDRLSGRNNG